MAQVISSNFATPHHEATNVAESSGPMSVANPLNDVGVGVRTGSNVTLIPVVVERRTASTVLMKPIPAGAQAELDDFLKAAVRGVQLYVDDPVLEPEAPRLPQISLARQASTPSNESFLE